MRQPSPGRCPGWVVEGRWLAALPPTQGEGHGAPSAQGFSRRTSHWFTPAALAARPEAKTVPSGATVTPLA